MVYNSDMKEEIQNIKNKIVGEILRQRQLRDLTQRQMADKLGITEQAYFNIENGKVKIEKLHDWLEKIIKL